MADEIPVEKLTCVGKYGVQLPIRLLNSMLKAGKMPPEWGRCILILGGKEIYKNVKITKEYNYYHTPVSYGKE